MILKLTDEFLDKYHIKEFSKYDNNYYKLPFAITCDGDDYYILRIACDEFANEYGYSLCYENDGISFDNRYIIPSSAELDYYELDLDNYSKDMIWY